jgi:hypothetical protein
VNEFNRYIDMISKPSLDEDDENNSNVSGPTKFITETEMNNN